MKNSFKLRKFFAFLFFASIATIIYHYFNPELSIYYLYAGIFVFGSSLTYLYVYFAQNKTIKKMDWMENRLKLWNSISYRVKRAGENSFNEMPLGIVVFNDDKVIEWANNYAKKIFLSPLVDRKIELISQELYANMKILTDFDITLYGKIFGVSVLSEDNIIYLTDKTDIRALEQKYRNRTLTLGIINLDNLSPALASLDAQEKARQMSNAIGILSRWVEKYDIYLRGYSEEQYLLIMDNQQLHQIIDEQFKILEEIKSYFLKEDLRITASIGIASADIVSQKLFETAATQLELALNRGGDQAVVYENGVVSYYGARTTTIENRSPVHVRVKTEQFVDKVKESEQILIMTHDNSDADAFGSCLAVYKIVAALNKPVKIVFDPEKIDPTINNVYEEIKMEHVNVLDYFILPKDALTWMTNDTLLVITDVQYQNLLLDEKVYKQAKKLAIIDHHRRNNFAIANYDYLYTQTSASSTVELVVEMLEFVEVEVDISDIEATWMLMGVIVDTNNLMYRISYRTFNILSILQKFGAEIPKVQRYLRENLQEYVERVSALNKLDIIEGKYGIAIAGDNIYARSAIAKIADTIISVNNIKAAFCIGKISETEIAISARSLDEMNVQVIMEQLGGGGHYNNAAAQFKNTTIELVKEALIEKLKRIDEGGQQTMKIILTKDVKGKGKEGDIIDIPSGHANFLIRSEQAVMATVDNIKQLEKKNAQEKEEQERHLAEMKALKGIIDKTPVTVSVRVGKEGKLFGSVSGKLIIDEYKTQNGISLDKRKMIYDKDIDQLGSFKIPIQLHKEVTAEITLFVVEKK